MNRSNSKSAARAAAAVLGGAVLIGTTYFMLVGCVVAAKEEGRPDDSMQLGDATLSSQSGCSSNYDCKGNRVCVDGACQSAQATAGCSSDFDCKGGRVCISGECKAAQAAPAVAGCSSNFDCKGGRVCEAGACVARQQNVTPVVAAKSYAQLPSATFPPLPRDPNKFLLAVGVATYQQDLPASTGSDNDARAFAEFAEQQLGVPRQNMWILVGDKATRSSVEARLDEQLPKLLTPASTLYVMFAGHGAPDPDTGDGYLVPWDADPRFIKSQGIRMQSLLAQIDKLPAAHRFVFVDACFSGAGGRSVLAEGTRPLVPVKELQAPVSKTVVLTASGARETTGATSDGAHGLFSYFLLSGMSGQADSNHDGHVTVRELQTFLEQQVGDEAARANRDQHPQVLSSPEQLDARVY